jgi:hypothetical protein
MARVSANRTILQYVNVEEESHEKHISHVHIARASGESRGSFCEHGVDIGRLPNAETSLFPN